MPMAKPISHHTCPVCSFPGLNEPARSKKAGGGSFEICPCCGFQHGVDDDDKGITYSQARTAWTKGGAKWFSKSQKQPQGWIAKSQLLSGPKAGERATVSKKSNPRPKAEVKLKKHSKSKR